MQHSGPGRSDGDPYHVLGVNVGASREDIVRAYRRAVYHAHPDTQPDDPHATARFRALTGACDLLSDPGRRAGCDRQHSAGRPDAIARWPGSLPLLSPYGQPVWAGPVHIEPPAAEAPDHDERSSPATDFEDPPVILGRRLGRGWSWPW
jgi:curved DNA-binding protein CbpA